MSSSAFRFGTQKTELEFRTWSNAYAMNSLTILSLFGTVGLSLLVREEVLLTGLCERKYFPSWKHCSCKQYTCERAGQHQPGSRSSRTGWLSGSATNTTTRTAARHAAPQQANLWGLRQGRRGLDGRGATSYRERKTTQPLSSSAKSCAVCEADFSTMCQMHTQWIVWRHY